MGLERMGGYFTLTNPTGGSVRSQILDSALQLFREKGYHATSLTDIVKAANCSKGALYHHFASKEDLLCLIHETFIEYELEMGEAARVMPGTATDRLQQMIVDLIRSIELYRPHVTVFFEERRFLTSDKFALVKKKRDRYEAIMREIVAEGIKNGEFAAHLDPRVVTFGIFGMCNWTYQWLRPDGKMGSREVADLYASIILAGLRQPLTEAKSLSRTDHGA